MLLCSALSSGNKHVIIPVINLQQVSLRATTTGSTAASSSLPVSVTSWWAWRNWTAKTSWLRPSTSRSSASPACWSAKPRWSWAATWPTGGPSRPPSQKHRFRSFGVSCQSFPFFFHQPASREEEEEGIGGLPAALVVRVHRLVPAAVHQRNINLLHPAVRLSVRQREVHQVGHIPGPVALWEHLHPAASQGGENQKNLILIQEVSVFKSFSVWDADYRINALFYFLYQRLCL